MNNSSRRAEMNQHSRKIVAVSTLLLLCLWIGEGKLSKPAGAEEMAFSRDESTLPVISLRAEEPLGTEALPANLEILIREGNGQEAVIETKVTGRKSASGETITVKLNADAEDAASDLTLPGLGSSNEWKLYLIPREDVFSMMLAFQIWNESCQDPRLQIPAQYAEVTVNDEYLGLCILRPKVTQAYRTQLKKPKVALNTDDMDREEIPRTLYQQYAPENLVDMALYCQATFAYANLFEDIKFIKTAEDVYYVVPGKPEYVFGNLPRRYHYLSWQFDQRVLSAQDFGLEGEKAENFYETMAERWSDARLSNLSDSSIQALLNQELAMLRDSGYAARTSVLIETEEGADGDEMEAQLTRLWQGIQSRFQYLDAYYRVEYPLPEMEDEAAPQGMETAAFAPEVNENQSLAPIDYDLYNGFQNIFLTWEVEGEAQQVKLFCQGLNAYAFLPAYGLQTELDIAFDSSEYALKIEGKKPTEFLRENSLQPNRIYDLEITYKSVGPQREKLTYAFQILSSSPVPALFVETFNGTLDYIHLDKENYEPGSFLCVDENGRIDSAGEMKKFHKRGTTSSFTVQKSYTLVASAPVDLLGLGAAAKWCLVGPGVDPTQTRNAIAYSLAQEMELDFAVDFRYVDLYCNGEYCGLKLLVEPVEVGSHRVEEDQIDFLVKVDNVDLESNHYWAMDGRMVQVLYPANPQQADLEELQRRTDRILQMVESCDTPEKFERLQQYLDVNSFAKKYMIDALVNECDRNVGSTFYYWKDGKLYAGPLWDCDRGSGVEMNWRGNCPNLNSYYNGVAETLMVHSPEFRALIQETAVQSESAIRHFQTHGPEWTEAYADSQRMTALRYPEYSILDAQGLVDFHDIDADLAYLQFALLARTELLWDTFLHPEDYHHLLIHFDETCWAGGGTKIYWLPKGEQLFEEMLQALRMASQKQRITYENGEEVRLDLPVTGDLRLKCMD